MLAIVVACYTATAFNVDQYGLTAGGPEGGEHSQSWTARVFSNMFSMPFLVTAEDRDAFVTTTAYVLYYCVRFEVGVFIHASALLADRLAEQIAGHMQQVKTWVWWKRLLLGANFQTTSTQSVSRAPRPINPVLGSISVAVQRIYGSLDNPYTSTITFLLVTWTLHKISMMERSMARYYDTNNQANKVPFKWASILDILLDCVLVSKFLYAGVVIQVCDCHAFSCLNTLHCN